PGTAQGEAGPGAEGSAAGTVTLGGPGDRRPGLRATEPGGDGGSVHAAGGALRAGQCAGDEQPGVLALGANLQGPDDDGGGDRPAGAPQRDRGAERAELSLRGGQADPERTAAEGRLRGGDGRRGCGPGYATLRSSSLRSSSLRSARPTPPQGLPLPRG